MLGMNEAKHGANALKNGVPRQGGTAATLKLTSRAGIPPRRLTAPVAAAAARSAAAIARRAAARATAWRTARSARHLGVQILRSTH